MIYTESKQHLQNGEYVNKNLQHVFEFELMIYHHLHLIL